MARRHNYEEIFKSSKRRKKSTKHYRQIVISIAGAHGVGKSTIYERIKETFKENELIQCLPERLAPVPPYPFGSKDQNIAFKSEVHFMQQMGERNLLVKKIKEYNKEMIIILDRSPISVLVYSSALNLPIKDFKILEDQYRRSFDWVDEFVIYLHASPETIMKRITHRGSLHPERKEWNEEDFQYLQEILKSYELFFHKLDYYKKKRVVKLDTEGKNIDQVMQEVIEIIENKSGLPIYQKFTLPAAQQTLDKFWAQD